MTVASSLVGAPKAEEPENVDPASALHHASDVDPVPEHEPEAEHEVAAVEEEHEEEAAAHEEERDDISDMVNMLQGGIPKARPVSMLSIPDEIEGEIPDEE